MLGNDFYVISDTHFYHKNIERFCGRPEQIERLMDTLPHLSYWKQGTWTQEAFMVERWNSVVKPGDKVLHLGDVFFASDRFRYAGDIQPRLNGDKYLILGNHDKSSMDWEMYGYKVIGEFGMRINGKMVTFSHYPMWFGDLNSKQNYRHVHGHIHNNGYPRGKGQDGWRLGTLKKAPNQINVSVEMIDYTPRKIGELIK